MGFTVSPSPHLKRRLIEPWAHLPLGWMGLGSLLASGEISGAGADVCYEGCASQAVVGRRGAWGDGRETPG